MEYLGDAVLQLVVTEWQYARHETAEEGVLTRERQRLVCEDALLEAVKALDLEEYLLYFGGRANVGKKTVSSLFETVIAAIYLDGGYLPAKEFILAHGRLEEEAYPVNHKGALQEYLQKRGKETPIYEVNKTGKDNAPIFRATVRAEGVSAIGDGRSKKEAEQEAALLLLEKLERKK
jgi:ribonuclease-3